MTHKPDREEAFWAALWRESLRALALGWELAIPIFAGALLGFMLDRGLGTRYIFTIGLLVFGIAVSYYNLARFIQRLDHYDRPPPGDGPAEGKEEK